LFVLCGWVGGCGSRNLILNAITRPRAGHPILNRFGEAVCCHQKVYKFHKSGSVEFWQGVYIMRLKKCLHVCV
jgi:hypothetical protein